MIDSQNQFRVTLTGKSVEDLKAMMKDLRGTPGTSGSPSDLASWVIETFYREHYDNHKHDLSKRFRKLKKFISELVKSGQSDDEIMAQINGITRSNKRRSKSQNKSENMTEKDNGIS